MSDTTKTPVEQLVSTIQTVVNFYVDRELDPGSKERLEQIVLDYIISTLDNSVPEDYAVGAEAKTKGGGGSEVVEDK